MTGDPEVAITVTVPDGATQILVRIPHLVSRVCPEDVQVDFRGSADLVWTPSEFFNGSVKATVQ